MRNERFRAALSFAAHLVILVSTVLCVLGLLLFVERPDERVHIEIFRYYTTLSNILGALIAVPLMIGAVLRLAGKEPAFPRRRGKQRALSRSIVHAVIIGSTSMEGVYSGGACHYFSRFFENCA